MSGRSCQAVRLPGAEALLLRGGGTVRLDPGNPIQRPQHGAHVGGFAAAHAFLFGDCELGRVVGPAAEDLDLILARELLVPITSSGERKSDAGSIMARFKSTGRLPALMGFISFRLQRCKVHASAISRGLPVGCKWRP